MDRRYLAGGWWSRSRGSCVAVGADVQGGRDDAPAGWLGRLAGLRESVTT